MRSLQIWKLSQHVLCWLEKMEKLRRRKGFKEWPNRSRESWRACTQSCAAFWKTARKRRMSEIDPRLEWQSENEGASEIKSFVPVRSCLLSSYRCIDQSARVSDSGFVVVVASSGSSVVSSDLIVVVSALLRISRLWTSPPVASFICWKWNALMAFSVLYYGLLVGERLMEVERQIVWRINDLTQGHLDLVIDPVKY